MPLLPAITRRSSRANTRPSHSTRSREATCHNADDYEGDLDLTSYKLVVGAGYEDDPYVVKSEPDKSYLLEVCELPKDDEMHMPPEDEEQLKPEELATLRKWIADGCPE